MEPGHATSSGASPGDDAPVRIRLLGSFAVELPDGSVAGPWTRPPARRIVAILALAPGHRLGREVLAERLFPGHDARPATRALAKALSMARAAIERPSGRSVFVVDRVTIGLREGGVAIDLDDHVQGLRSGLDRVDDELVAIVGPMLTDRGTLLQDDPYEDWAIDARDDLEAIRARARLAVARALDRTGAPVAARCVAWRAVADADPADEEAWTALVRAERDAERPDRALRASYEARAALRESLDSAPGPELEALHRDLITRSPEWARPSPSAVERRTFGREGPLAAIDRFLTVLAAGRPRDTILVGPSGIGKTRLLDDAVELARARGIVVGRGTSVPEDRRVPYSSLRQALHGLPLELIRVGPRLARLLGQDAGPGGTSAAGSARDLALLATEVVDGIEQLAVDRPVLLVLDDVQWVDPALRTVLQRLAATPGQRRWALLIAARTDEAGAPVPAGLGDVVSIPPLSDASIADIVRDNLAVGSDGTTITYAVARSAGNPLFAQELARAGPEVAGPAGGLPERIAEVIGRRFDQRSAAARRILPILALGDETIRNDVLLAVLSSEDGVLDVVDELISTSLVQRTDEGLRLSHPLIRQVAADLLNPIRRARVHRRYADAIEGLGMDRADIVLSAVRHRVSAWESGRLAEDAAPAASAAWRGALIADEEFSIDAARDLTQAGLAAWDAAPVKARDDLANEAARAMIRLGELALDAGDEAAAIACFDRALGLDLDDEWLAAAWSALGGIPYRRGDMAGAAIAYRRGLDALHDGDGVPAAMLRSTLGWALWRAGEPGAFALVSDSAAVLAERGEPAVASRALDRLAILATDPETALDASDRAFVQLQRGSDRREFGTLMVHRAVIELRVGRVAAAMRSVDEALALFRAAGDGYMETVCLWTRADVLDASGDLDAALDARDEEARLLIAIDNPRNLAGCQTHRAGLLRRLGRPVEAAAAHGAALSAAERSGDHLVIAETRAAASAAGFPV